MKKKTGHSYGSRTLWTALAVVIILAIAFVVATRLKPEASISVLPEGKADRVLYFPFGPQNPKFVGAGINSAIIYPTESAVDLKNQRVKLYRVEEDGKLKDVALSEPFKINDAPGKGVEGITRSFGIAASLAKGEVYRVIFYDKGEKDRATTCRYADFAIPWIYQLPSITFSNSPGQTTGNPAFPGSGNYNHIDPIDYSCNAKGTTVARPEKPTIPGELTYVGTPGGGLTSTGYKSYVISNVRSTSDIAAFLLGGTKLNFTGKSGVREKLDCYYAKKGWATTSPLAITVTGKWVRIGGSDIFKASDASITDPGVLEKCSS